MSMKNSAATEDDVRRYRRRKAQRRGERQFPRPRKDVEDFIAFARTWAPFGGASDEDVFVKYGMSRAKFVNTLWKCIPESVDCDPQIVQQLLNAYPPER
jgi:hypothetical protein